MAVLIYVIELATHAESLKLDSHHTHTLKYFRQIKSLNNKKKISKSSKECTEVNFRLSDNARFLKQNTHLYGLFPQLISFLL